MVQFVGLRSDNNDYPAAILTSEGRAFCAVADLSSGAVTSDRGARRGPVKPLPNGALDYINKKISDRGRKVAIPTSLYMKLEPDM